MPKTDVGFSPAVAEFYDRYLGEPLFRPQAEPMVGRLADLRTGAVLETAAGTGIVTAMLAQVLPPEVAITATDLTQAMLDRAGTKPGADRVTFRQADALELPFPDNAFDAVVCQFGVMFFPDKPRGHREAHRVLKPGGRYVFNTWAAIQESPAAEIAEATVGKLYPEDPPRFFSRVPWGYYDEDRIRADLRSGGFAGCTIERVATDWRIGSVRDAAMAFCQGTPLRGEIEARDPQGLDRATDAVSKALSTRFGLGPVALPVVALLVEATKAA